MNKRIRELAEDCTVDFVDGRGVSLSEIDVEKFAELIIQDCVTQVALLGISNYENEDVMWAVETSIENIKERFGITQ